MTSMPTATRWRLSSPIRERPRATRSLWAANAVPGPFGRAVLDRIEALTVPVHYLRGNGERETVEAIEATSPPANEDLPSVTAAITTAQLSRRATLERDCRSRWMQWPDSSCDARHRRAIPVLTERAESMNVRREDVTDSAALVDCAGRGRSSGTLAPDHRGAGQLGAPERLGTGSMAGRRCPSPSPQTPLEGLADARQRA
jgi:hypothetical protein